MSKKFLLLFIILFIFIFFNLSLSAHSAQELVVYGGEPEGIMTAVAAARSGTETLLIMHREYPGGLMTAGGLNYLDLNYDPRGNILNRGLFLEWYNKMGGSLTFSIDKAIDVFNEILKEEDNLTVLRNYSLKKVETSNGKVDYLKFTSKNEVIELSPHLVIDTTQDGDLAYKAGAPFFIGNKDHGLEGDTMAVTLNIPIKNVNWDKIKYKAENNKYGTSFINPNHAWGFSEIGKLYEPKNENIIVRGLNIARINNTNNIYINAMLILNTNPLDEKSRNTAYKTGKEEAKYILSFLKEKLSAFENAELLPFPDELYRRESRHLIADYQLKTEHLFENKLPDDTIALASYPLDYQAYRLDHNGFVLFNPKAYGIPYRSLLPENLDNLLVVGRSSGYSSLAASSARVLPTGMAAGEAAGVSATVALENDINFREGAEEKSFINIIQDYLNLNPAEHNYPPVLNNDPATEAVKFLSSWGLVIGGYNNDFQLNEKMSENDFAQMIIKGLKRRNAPILHEWVPGSLETLSTENKLTRSTAAKLLLAAESYRVLEMDENEYYKTAVNENLISDDTHQFIKDKTLIERREAYILLADFLQRYDIDNNLKKLRSEL